MDLTTLALAKSYTDKQIEKNWPGGNAEKEVYKVTITNDNDTYKADKTFTEVIEAIQQNKIVQAHIEMGGNAFILPLCTLTENMVLVYGGSASTTSLAIVQTIAGQINVMTEELATKTYVDEAIANIPSGGGSAPKEMELIASGTMTEDARGFEITLDSNGNPFELTKAILYVDNFSAGAEITKTVQCHVTLGHWFVGSSGAPKDNNIKIMAYADSNGCAYVANGGLGAQSGQSGNNAIIHAVNYKPNTIIDKASVQAMDSTLKIRAGLTYELWGVRK